MKSILLSVISLFSIAAMSATPATLPLDVGASKVNWKATKKVGPYHTGTIGLKSGEISFNEKDQLTGGKIIIDMPTIKVTDMPPTDENNARLTGHLNSADFFDTAKNKEATLVIKNVKSKDASNAEVTADLTIKGVTHPVKFPVFISTQNGIRNAKGKVNVDRTLYGIRYGTANTVKGQVDKIINNTFEIDFDVTAKKM